MRGMTTNGLTWSIDGSAPGASEIKPGRVIFVTGRVVGRVLAVERHGGNLAVTLGPVDITEVIRDCNIDTKLQLDLSQMLTYAAPDYPGAVADAPAETESSLALPPGVDPFSAGVPAAPAAEGPRWEFAAYHPARARDVDVQDVTPIDGFPLDIGTFKQLAFCCGGLGVKLLHDGEDAKITAYAIIHLDHPSLHFNLVIANGDLRTAEVELGGAAGLTVHFEAGTAMGQQGNINKRFFVPVDLSLPITGFGVPFAVTFRQTMVLTTSFTAQNGLINSTGDYGFGGSFTMGLHDGSWGIGGPTSLSTKQNLLASVGGASFGVNGLTFAYGGKVIVGIGAFGFVTGPYMGYNTVVGTEKGSSMMVASPSCRRAILDMSMRVGVGYMIPQVVTNAINFILTRLNVTPIQSSAGVEHLEPLIHKDDVFPAGCGDKPA